VQPNQLESRHQRGPNNLNWSQKWITTMPNHVKALVKQNSATSDVLPVSDIQRIERAQTSIAAATEVSLKFLNINVIEVFVGYNNNTESKWAEIKNPRWQTLDASLYNSNVGATLLCRLRPYQNLTFGIVRDVKTEPPTIDEYFFLTPSAGGTTIPGAVLPPHLTTPPPAPAFGTPPSDLSGLTAGSFSNVPDNLAERFALANMPVNLGGF